LTATPLRVGVLGVGSIGEHYCRNLLRAYPSLLVFDGDEAKRRSSAAAGATPVGGTGELGAACDVVVVSLPNPDAVRTALAGPGGLIAAASAGALVIDTSTVSPQTNREMHALAAERGVGYLDAPVSGGEPMEAGVEGARAGTMTFMVGGDAADFERARPVLEALGSFFFLLGPPGSGSVVKLISNLCSGIQLLVAAEAFALGAACGFSVEQLIDVFRCTVAATSIRASRWTSR
jgi:3-hydroxyisobutyrate dehydrogenase